MTNEVGGVEMEGEDSGDISWEDEKQAEEADDAEDKELGR
jgi:hypothetical protein